MTVSVDKHGHREKKFSEIQLNRNVDWQEIQFNFLKGNYSKHPFYKEVMGVIDYFFLRDFTSLMDVTMESVKCIKDILEIKTKTIMQSEIQYDKSAKKSNLMLKLTKGCEGDTYLSGNGARKYMDICDFEDEGVKVQYLKFNPFVYPQYRSNQFVQGLSVLDLLFNVGLNEAKALFWENIQNNEQFECIE